MSLKRTPEATPVTVGQSHFGDGPQSSYGRSVRYRGCPSAGERRSVNPELRVNVWERDTPKKGRRSLSEGYEKEVSGREQWWRKDIRVTPLPGAYETETFLKEFEDRPATYAFKNDGRRKEADVLRKGEYLLPGAYEIQDKGFIYDLVKSRNTYSFRNSARKSLPTVKDKDVNVSPDKYQMESYMSVVVHDGKNKHANFKSSSKRFPTIYFKGTKNPSPCHYETKPPKVPHTVTSSFKSKTPRFSTSHTKVPGPGTYDSVFQYPMPPTISKMGRNHGLFFTSAFQS